MKSDVKILIVGADGQLGQAFTRELEEKGINHLSLGKNKLDITDFKEVGKVVKEYGPDFLINCAAYNDVDRAEEDWETAFSVNGTAIKNLSIITRENDCVLVHYSTDYVFDGKKDSPYTIADIPCPISKYGESKLLGEKFVQEFSKNYYLVRLSSVFGNNPKASFPLKVLSWAKKREELKVVEDQVFSPSFTEDIVRVTLDLINTKQFGLYHMTNSGYCSRYEWAKFILEKSKWKGKVIPCKSKDFNLKAKRPKFSVLDNSLLEKVINNKLPTWQEATERFFKKNMKKLLVTGGAGFIGSNFIHYILRKYKNYKVINLDKLTYAGNLENLKDIEKDSRYKFVKGKIG